MTDLTASTPWRRHRARPIPKYDIDRGVAGVYFIELRGVPFIKIGYTRDIHQRRASLQSNCPFRAHLTAFYAAKPSAEAMTHSILFRSTYEDEWFKYTREVERVMIAFDDWQSRNRNDDTEITACAFEPFLKGFWREKKSDDLDLLDANYTHDWFSKI